MITMNASIDLDMVCMGCTQYMEEKKHINEIYPSLNRRENKSKP